ncbi:ssDNA-binding protein [Mesorhizobium sp.]|uniref:ssDNA-binding protein n=1 Tax=Mesorhizobium sp. TaxID=1871066 RepID=UPI000FE821B0|nr:ssDNA-binding protein [Mesorhizobium sp.]RWE37412.1 MAG: DUF2815 family protein [Mesorhizobium sp.]
MAFKPSFNKETGVVKVLLRLSYCKVFEKTASTEGGKLLHRTNGLIDKNTEEGKASIGVINEAIKHLISTTWPGKDPAKFKEALGGDGPKSRWPLFDGDKYVNDEGDVREGYAGKRYLKLTNDRKFKLKKRNGEDFDDIDEAKELFVSGHWAIGYFHMYPIKDAKKGGNGIFTTGDALQFYKRDEQFSGGGIDDSEFDNYGDDEDDDFDSKPKGGGKSKAGSIDDDDLI